VLEPKGAHLCAFVLMACAYVFVSLHWLTTCMLLVQELERELIKAASGVDGVTDVAVEWQAPKAAPQSPSVEKSQVGRGLSKVANVVIVSRCGNALCCFYPLPHAHPFPPSPPPVAKEV
jgi:hypothetical protein